MKKIGIIAITLILLFSGCSNISSTTLNFELDSKGNYTGFKELPENYTAAQAEKDGCYVRVNSEVVAGEELLENFIQDASQGKDAGLRIVNIWDEGTYYKDLFFVDGYYRVFDSSSEDLRDYKFKHLLKAEGRLPNAAKSGTVTILTDDLELTYKDVMWTFLSSDMNYSKSVSPFKLVIME